jgi:tRNA 5-methylaminomethyl-2-thiouridine biosynthesis bifunctional protein
MNWIWNEEDGSLYSSEFQDIFYSKTGGLEETRAVFFQPNRIPDLFYQAKNPKPRFHIGELGFGTGLNAFLTFFEWQSIPKEQRIHHLHYLSYEIQPLPWNLIQTVFRHHFPNKELPPEFLRFWKHLIPGCNRLSMDSDHFTLDLWVGDASILLPQTEGVVDAWFWDGFSPKNNPGLWSESVFLEVARLSKKGTTGSTYTASRQVKSLLDQVGFEWIRLDQKGSKKHSLKAIYTKDKDKTLSFPKNAKPWCHVEPHPFDLSRFPIAIIGGGIAGASLAYSFQRRNISVQIIEKESSIGSGASGNPSAIVAPHLSKHSTPYSRVSLQAYLYAIRIYQDSGLWIHKPHYHYFSSDELSKYQAIKKAYSIDGDLFHIETKDQKYVAVFPEGGAVSPISILNHFTQNATVIRNANVQDFQLCGDHWEILYSQGNESFQSKLGGIIWADGHEAKNTKTGRFYHTVRGQIEYIESHVSDSQAGSVYACPNENGGGVLGATYDEFHLDTDHRETERIELWETWKELFPGSDLRLKNEPKGRVSFRSQTKDRVPVLGVVLDELPLQYKKYYKAFRTAKFPQLSNQGLYQIRGLGSRGFTHAPFLAEELVSEILGEPSPFNWEDKEPFSPMRFHLRELKESSDFSKD